MEASWRTLRCVGSNINIVMGHFMPEEDDREENMDETENKEEHDMDMERIEVDMVDISMNETLQDRKSVV